MGQDLSIINSECKLCLKYTFNILEDTLKVFLNIYLFYLAVLSLGACRIFVVSCGIFLRGTWMLWCGAWAQESQCVGLVSL